MRAKFISFEGTEGVGKTTMIQAVADRLDEQGIPSIKTREPGGSAFAERLRELLLDPDSHMSDDSELLLMYAARCDHLHRLIEPALAQGQWVLCDRFNDSTFAYQGYGRRHGDPQVLAKITLLTEQFVTRLPDVTIWLDLPVITGMNRAKSRGKLDRIEQQDIAFFERVHQGFASLAQQEPERIRRIDATGNIATVTESIMSQIASSW